MNPTRDGLEAAVNARLAEDPAFREALLADPKAAVGELLGIQLPEFVSITVHPETLTDVHLVLPPSADVLRDEDLELVAGGTCWDDWICG